MAAWPHSEMTFDKDGGIRAPGRDELLRQVREAGSTDLVVFSHGWNNSVDGARALYRSWLGQAERQLPEGSTATVSSLGVFWPSMLWPDEPSPVPDDAGAAVGLASASSPGAPVRALTAVYEEPEQHKIIARLAELLDERPTSAARLTEFHGLMRGLAETESSVDALEDAGPEALLADSPRAVAERFAAGLDLASGSSDGPGDGGAASLGLRRRPAGALGQDLDGEAAGRLGDIGNRLWDGAKEALRQFTYYQMKGRAGRIGRAGLGPLLAELVDTNPHPRVHLVGHSFGARLVSFALAGLPDGPPQVASLTLLQGAFSHSAFAPKLPLDPSRSGALRGREKRVSGPIVVCFSQHDTAVGVLYPLASAASQDDAADLAKQQLRWGGMGYDGAQGVVAAELSLIRGRRSYDVPSSGFVNVDAAAVVRTGGPPSGAHSDIVHAELAGLWLSAAGLT